jgi:hypothetical protein
VVTVAGEWKYLPGSFHPFVAFEIVQNNVRLCIDTRDTQKMQMGKIECLVTTSK